MKLTLAILILFSVWQAAAQDTCDHESNSKERFDAVRLLAPSRITHHDKAIIEYVHQDAHSTNVGTVNVDASSILPKTIDKKKFYWILICIKDLHVYTVVEVGANQIRGGKPK